MIHLASSLLPSLFWTARSSSPLEAGCYGAERRCFTPLHHRNSWNSLDVKVGPLSDTIVRGSPCVANVKHKLSMVASADVEDTICASINCEMSIHNNEQHLALNWPCMVYMKLGPWLFPPLPWRTHCLTLLSKSPSRPGHKT